MTERYKISILGAGNVGYHLSKLLFEAGHEIIQVFDRDINKAEEAASNAKAISSFDDLNPDADIFLICVKDDAVANVAAQITVKGKILAHTSGASSMNILKQDNNHYGVFYPVQTFSRKIPVSLKDISICVYGNDEGTKTVLSNLARSLSAKPLFLNDQRRLSIHVAAVIANNFSNHLFHIAQKILEKEELSFDIIKPSVLENIRKTDYGSPAEMQTGPAARNDEITLSKHLSFLENEGEWKKIYEMMTKSIQEMKGKD